jgi:tetratricopeptide (TPR) repeat protein
MIKHYFCKANAKFQLGRYDEAIKDYTNAIIVYKEQAKNESEVKEVAPAKKGKTLKEEGE